MSGVKESRMEGLVGDEERSRSGAPDGRPEGGVPGMASEIGGESPDLGPRQGEPAIADNAHALLG